MLPGSIHQTHTAELMKSSQKRLPHTRQTQQTPSRRDLPTFVKMSAESNKRTNHKRSVRVVKRQSARDKRLSTHSTPDLFERDRQSLNTQQRPQSIKKPVPPVQQTYKHENEHQVGIKINVPTSVTNPTNTSFAQIQAQSHHGTLNFSTQQSQIDSNASKDESNLMSIRDLLANKRMKKTLALVSEVQDMQTKLAEQVTKTVNETLNEKLKSQHDKFDQEQKTNQQRLQTLSDKLTTQLESLERQLIANFNSIQKDVHDGVKSFEVSVDEKINAIKRESHQTNAERTNIEQTRVFESMTKVLNENLNILDKKCEDILLKYNDVTSKQVELDKKTEEISQKANDVLSRQELSKNDQTLNNLVDEIGRKKQEVEQSLETLKQEISAHKESFRRQIMDEFDQEIQRQKNELESHLKSEFRQEFNERIIAEKKNFMDEVVQLMDSTFTKWKSTLADQSDPDQLAAQNKIIQDQVIENITTEPTQEPQNGVIIESQVTDMIL